MQTYRIIEFLSRNFNIFFPLLFIEAGEIDPVPVPACSLAVEFMRTTGRQGGLKPGFPQFLIY